MHEITCEYCGKRFKNDRTKTRFCSKLCYGRYRRELMKNGKTYVDFQGECKHNKGVACSMKKCSTCGWNPAVAKKRMVAYG